MCQMTTTGQVQTHDAVVGLKQGCVDSKVCRAASQQASSNRGTMYGCHVKVCQILPAGVRLYVYSPALRVQVEGLQSPSLAEVLDLVDVVVASIVPRSWLALGVLVCET